MVLFWFWKYEMISTDNQMQWVEIRKTEKYKGRKFVIKVKKLSVYI